jgi:hypothetical protein
MLKEIVENFGYCESEIPHQDLSPQPMWHMPTATKRAAQRLLSEWDTAVVTEHRSSTGIVM